MNMIDVRESLPKRIVANLRTPIKMKGFVIGAITLVVLFCFSSTVTFYKQQIGKHRTEIETLRQAVDEISVQQRAILRRSKRSIATNQRARRGASEDVELVLRMNSGNNTRYMSAYGVSYTRWGRRDCAGSAEMVYHGIPIQCDFQIKCESHDLHFDSSYAAGSHYTHTGGGSNYLCLHSNVTYTQGSYVSGNQGTSYIYGVEYKDSNTITNIFDMVDTTESGSVYLHTVPCAVCIARFKVTQIMIPGRDTCPDDWTMEYGGYIMGENHSAKHPSRYICVDKRPQAVPNTQGSQAASQLHVVETQCTSLVCEPYVAGREIACVVCSI